MSLKDNLNTTDGTYQSPKVRQVLYDHKAQILERSTTTPVDGVTALKFRNNLTGLLNELGVPPKLWNITLYVNALTMNGDYSELTVLQIPDTSHIEYLVKFATTVKNPSF